jgi:hypothetical protein
MHFYQILFPIGFLFSLISGWVRECTGSSFNFVFAHVANSILFLKAVQQQQKQLIPICSSLSSGQKTVKIPLAFRSPKAFPLSNVYEIFCPIRDRMGLISILFCRFWLYLLSAICLPKKAEKPWIFK